MQGITSENNGDYYCINCFYSFRIEPKLKSNEIMCKNHDYCYIEMPEKGKNIIKYNQGEKYMSAPFVIYADN